MILDVLRDVWLNVPAGLFLARGVVMIPAFTLHELAHGLAASAFGDTTAREHGRLTLNPLPHLESLGAILGVLTGLGWSRPTPIRPYKMRKPAWLAGMIAALAGPCASLLLAAAGAALLRVRLFQPAIPWHDWPSLAEWLTVWTNFNLMLAVLNVLPLFPLDGFQAIHNLLPLGASAWWEQASGWTTLVFGLGLVIFLWLPTPLLSSLVGPPIRWIQHVMLGW
jgi:Zn-dependent protease